jgi:hypothetical protein
MFSLVGAIRKKTVVNEDFGAVPVLRGFDPEAMAISVT